ncbi:MAG: site-specific DNA-methyltransferase [Bacteroidia bacterium]
MAEVELKRFLDLFEGLRPSEDWSFKWLSQKETSYLTHSYHQYPAKFIPQLASRLIQEHSREGEWVLDPFMGSGTTLVEARLLRRPSVGIDVNPVAHLIAEAKTHPLPPPELTKYAHFVKEEFYARVGPSLFSPANVSSVSNHSWNERLTHWFPEKVLVELKIIQSIIEQLPKPYYTFFACALSGSLKALSFWHNRSIKPMRKPDKRIPPVETIYFRKVQKMLKANAEYWQALQSHDGFSVITQPLLGDARALPIPNEQVHLIVTSPPYVTSYEYADLHQLSALWFGWMEDRKKFREPFIGRSLSKSTAFHSLYSDIADAIVGQIYQKSPSKANEVATYFADMAASFQEMYRVLLPKGIAAIVIGNTEFLGVKVSNAEAFMEQLYSIGFTPKKVILREIPSKTLPQARDKRTGKFTTGTKADFSAYPVEYILIIQK